MKRKQVVKEAAKKKRGGKRAGSGRKKKYGEATRTVAVRIPISRFEDFVAAVKQLLENWRET